MRVSSVAQNHGGNGRGGEAVEVVTEASLADEEEPRWLFGEEGWAE
jgi:hypothetical protein